MFRSNSSLSVGLQGLLWFTWVFTSWRSTNPPQTRQMTLFGETARVQGDRPDTRAHLPDPIVSLRGGNTLQRWSFKSEPRGLLLNLQECARDAGCEVLQQRGYRLRGPVRLCRCDTGLWGRADRGSRASREVSGSPWGDLYPRKNSSHISSEDPGVTPGRYFPYS